MNLCQTAHNEVYDSQSGVITVMPAKAKDKDDAINIKEKHLGKHKALGLYWVGSNRIEIDPRLDSKEYLYVLIHELSHMALPEATEEGIIRISEIIAKGVWQQGYRRIKE